MQKLGGQLGAALILVTVAIGSSTSLPLCRCSTVGNKPSPKRQT
jgi:hypothetical protein